MSDGEREQGQDDFAARQTEMANAKPNPPDSDTDGILDMARRGRASDTKPDVQGPEVSWRRPTPYPSRARNR
jgi:hypothetical protein